MEKKLVIGIGNPIREDDGLGWVIIDQLQKQINDPSVDFVVVQQLTMDLVLLVAATEFVYFIDALKDGSEGVISRSEVDNVLSPETPIAHSFSPHTLLAAVQSLYGKHPKAILFTVSAKNYAYSEKISPAIEAVIPELVTRISNELLLEEELEIT